MDTIRPTLDKWKKVECSSQPTEAGSGVGIPQMVGEGILSLPRVDYTSLMTVEKTAVRLLHPHGDRASGEEVTWYTFGMPPERENDGLAECRASITRI
jgi:hypothetical protein